MDEHFWYMDGLRFECQRCGSCCSGGPGHVWVSDEEITSIARRLQIQVLIFRKQYTINMDEEGIRLTERQNNDCVFFNPNQGCVIYEDRPRQCRTWPFWNTNIETHKNWNSLRKTCKGINRGLCHNLEVITDCAGNDGLPERK